MVSAAPFPQAGTMDISRRSRHLALESDGVLVERARSGEDAAFGLLYLRHHEAAWRVANAVTAFSPGAGDAVVEAFTRVLDTGPRRPGGDAALRLELLACVREVALERGLAPGATPSPPRADQRPGTTSKEIVLAEVEPLVTEALRHLDEPERTALWLADAEALTPREVARVMGLPRHQAAALAAAGRDGLRQALARLFAGCGPGPCRRLAPQVAGIEADGPAGGHDPADHVARCPICRMRAAEAGRPATLLHSAVPCSPLLGRPCRQRWRQRGQARRRRAVPALSAMLLLVAMVAITRVV